MACASELEGEHRIRLPSPQARPTRDTRAGPCRRAPACCEIPLHTQFCVVVVLRVSSICIIYMFCLSIIVRLERYRYMSFLYTVRPRHGPRATRATAGALHGASTIESHRARASLALVGRGWLAVAPTAVREPSQPHPHRPGKGGSNARWGLGARRGWHMALGHRLAPRPPAMNPPYALAPPSAASRHQRATGTAPYHRVGSVGLVQAAETHVAKHTKPPRITCEHARG